eukprot:TRINITY_DN4254_c0_g1_i11.p1 TRINITY_DN4254_c0_g1~~TRINITY_DN4254_c0_g1_i11.p1  ORF type:complete len:527 (-),score=93.48 TRINITY_DN4254_c0_g1_i11:84-1664(-)
MLRGAEHILKWGHVVNTTQRHFRLPRISSLKIVSNTLVEDKRSLEEKLMDLTGFSEHLRQNESENIPTLAQKTLEQKGGQEQIVLQPSPIQFPRDLEPKKFPPTSEWPIELLLLSGFWLIVMIYYSFTMSDSELEILSEKLSWGGKSEKLQVMGKLEFWLHFERVGLKVSDKFLSCGIVDELVATLNTSKTEEITEKASSLLAKLSANKACALKMHQIQALEVLRKFVDPHHLNVICTIANLVGFCPEALDGIMSDEGLVENILYTMAFSLRRNETRDIFIQRAIMRLLESVFYHPSGMSYLKRYARKVDNLLCLAQYQFDPLLLSHYNNILAALFSWYGQDNKITEDYPCFGRLKDAIVIRPMRYHTSTQLIICDVILVGLLSFFWTKGFQRFWLLEDFKPLTLQQKYWSKLQCWKSIPISIFFFTIFCGFGSFTEKATDDLLLFSEKNNFLSSSRTATGSSDTNHQPLVLPHSVINYLQENYGDSYYFTFLAFINFFKIPIFYYGLKLAPFALVPALIPLPYVR